MIAAIIMKIIDIQHPNLVIPFFLNTTKAIPTNNYSLKKGLRYPCPLKFISC